MAKILIIEDEKELLENLAFCLSLEDYEVSTAINGKLGILSALENIPDLIICDVNMPEMDGYEVLQEIRQNNSTKTIPFVFLTARSDKSDFRQGMELGADDYVSKPYTDEEILRAIHARLNKHNVIKDSYNAQIDELRKNIASTLPHELKTPLSAILAYSDILTNNLKELDEEDVLAMVKAINDAGKRLHHLFDNYIFYTNLFEYKVPIDENIDLKAKYAHQSIRKIINEIAMQYPKLGYSELKIEEANVNMLNSHFEKLMEELIDNSFKFSSEGQLVEIEANIELNKYIIVVHNVGIEFTKEQIEQIGGFMQFNRKYIEQQGIGLGLAIVKSIIALYDAEMLIESCNGRTTVTLKLPIID